MLNNELVEVTQADREAAWPVWDWAFAGATLRKNFMEGDSDEHHLVQAFARHRIAANPNPPQGRDAGLHADAVTIWRDAYVAVYGCEPSHPENDYQGAYDVIERTLTSPAISPTNGLREAYPVDERAFHVVKASGGPEGDHFRAKDRATLSSYPAPSREAAYQMASSLNAVVRFHVERACSCPSPALDEEGAIAAISSIVENAMNSAIPEPWEVSRHAAERILAFTRLRTAALDSASTATREGSAAQAITYNPVYGVTYEGADPTRGHVYRLVSHSAEREAARPSPRVIDHETFGPSVIVDGVASHDGIVIMGWKNQLQPRYLRLPGQAYLKDLLALMDEMGCNEVAIQPSRHAERLSLSRVWVQNEIANVEAIRLDNARGAEG